MEKHILKGGKYKPDAPGWWAYRFGPKYKNTLWYKIYLDEDGEPYYKDTGENIYCYIPGPNEYSWWAGPILFADDVAA